MTPEHGKIPELSPEQWEAGAEIAELCDLSPDVLGERMLWNGDVATVGYGLAHSAEHMDSLTVEEIRTAVFDGIAAHKAMLDGTAGNK